MKLFEEFKLYENMWDEPIDSEQTNAANASSAKNVYVIFSYYKLNSFDNFYLHGVCDSKADAAKVLLNEAMYRVENYQTMDTTLVCYLINPTEYDSSADAFRQAAESNYTGGQDLHWEYQDIVYALNDMVMNETPVYELSQMDIWADFYVAYSIKLGNNINNMDAHDQYDFISELKEDPKFNKFVYNRLTQIVNAI